MNHATHHEHHHHNSPESSTGHAHHADHSGHEIMFRNRFWVCLILTIPVLLYSPMIQEWLDFSVPEFSGSEFIAPLFSIVIFLYGGLPLLYYSCPD